MASKTLQGQHIQYYNRETGMWWLENKMMFRGINNILVGTIWSKFENKVSLMLVWENAFFITYSLQYGMYVHTYSVVQYSMGKPICLST